MSGFFFWGGRLSNRYNHTCTARHWRTEGEKKAAGPAFQSGFQSGWSLSLMLCTEIRTVVVPTGKRQLGKEVSFPRSPSVKWCNDGMTLIGKIFAPRRNLHSTFNPSITTIAYAHKLFDKLMDNPIRLIKQENGNYLQILSYAITHKHMNGSAIDCLGNPNETHVTQNHWPLKTGWFSNVQ